MTPSCKLRPGVVIGSAAIVAVAAVLFSLTSHVEFQISAPPSRSLWFTPALFQGRLLVISDDRTVLHNFEARVPTNRQLSVDLEWLAKEHNSDVQQTEVDIGKVAEMLLSLDSPGGQLAEMHSSLISSSKKGEALIKLHQMIFPFLKVPYHNLIAAAAEAKRHGKLVHSIVTWGPLDDQSFRGSARTLRHGPLAFSAIQELLQAYIVSSWSLTAELQGHGSFQADRATKEMAAACLNEYKFPVQIVCLLHSVYFPMN
ncbi:hypothetical protein MRX96_018614 [Rhipicephalus microplus]